ncbi:pyoverdine biosynthesis protein PvcB [Streptomyces abyssalis]|uniref:Pyoverdine biosynthesis protein PvcB n=1 Tax=Streptomyces abyssalis TaxID=933944 RepID=A0A1E7JTL2_9ACTN|nr:pyoverdine biosynthesis protein PvcB [Streptomyces abyssalis]OEU94327.1 pyoverdine biosynthesis protein PvcB [Streptomyces abyssalis]
MQTPARPPLAGFGAVLEAASPEKRLEDLPVAELRELVRDHHLLLLRGFSPFADAHELAAYCTLWGEISMWPFGAVLELTEHENPGDHIFDHRHVPLHWDGMYRPQVPEFQLFHCVSAPGEDQGGGTVFSQTSAVLRDADAGTRALWERARGTYRRKMEFYESTAVSPVVTAHPVTGEPVIRYNEPVAADDEFINHPDLEFDGVPEARLEEFHRTLSSALRAPGYAYTHKWRTGDLVVADNYTLLHGREAFTSRAPRHLRRVHVLGDPPLENPALRAGGRPPGS